MKKIKLMAKDLVDMIVLQKISTNLYYRKRLFHKGYQVLSKELITNQQEPIYSLKRNIETNAELTVYIATKKGLLL